MPPGYAICGDACVDQNSDVRNCGACGVVCPALMPCRGGVCERCQPGEVICTGGGNNVCVGDFTANDEHCGACNVACRDQLRGSHCAGGACVCPAGEIACDGECVDPETDLRNCGTCGNVCASGKCEGGVCVVCLDPSKTECDGECVDLQVNPYHCGSCGNACGVCTVDGVEIALRCIGGECRVDPEEAPGVTMCAGECVDLESDERHCGACGAACVPGALCLSGQCYCEGTADDPCGDTCCLEGQICCNDVCCDEGVTGCTSAGNCPGEPDCGCRPGEQCAISSSGLAICCEAGLCATDSEPNRRAIHCGDGVCCCGECRTTSSGSTFCP